MENELEQSLKHSVDGLIKAAEKNNEKLNMAIGIAELRINGIDYQMQMQFVSDKKIWVKEDYIQFTEVTKIHK